MAARLIPPLGDPFWAKDASGTTGFEALLRRCKDGRRTIKAMEEFVRERSRLEDEYGKSLLKLAKTGVVKEEFGTLRAAWDRQRNQTEKVGQLHVELSVALGDLAGHIRQYVPTLRDQSKKAVGLSKRYQASRTVVDRKRTVWDAKRKSKDESNSSPAAASGATVVVDDDCAYASIDAIECSGKVGGGNEGDQPLLDDACQMFEQLEIDRCDFVRKALWTVTNCDSLTCVERDLANEQVRVALERCDSNSDLKLFINRRRLADSGVSDPLHSPTTSESSDRVVMTEPSSSAIILAATIEAKQRQLLQQLTDQLSKNSAGRSARNREPGEVTIAGQQQQQEQQQQQLSVVTLTSPIAAGAAKICVANSPLMSRAKRAPVEQQQQLQQFPVAAPSSPAAEQSRRPRPPAYPVYEDVDLTETYFTLEPPTQQQQQQKPLPLLPSSSAAPGLPPAAVHEQPSTDCKLSQSLYSIVKICNDRSFGRTEQEPQQPGESLNSCYQAASDQQAPPLQQLLHHSGQPTGATGDLAAVDVTAAVDEDARTNASPTDGD